MTPNTDLTEDRPFHIESDLDGANILVLVASGRSQFNLGGWASVALGIVFLFVIDPAWYVVAAIAIASPITFVTLNLRGDRRVLRFTFKAGERLLNGVPFESGHVDYQRVTIDGHPYEIIGGLSKSEHGTLDALLNPTDRGGASDIPGSIQRLAERT